MSIWDSPDLKVGGEFVKFDRPGDAITGVVQVIRPHRFDDGSVAAQILMVTDQGEERTVTAGQVRLKHALAEQRPEAGDWISITLTQIEQRAGGKSLKHFVVEVRRGNGQAPAAPAAPQGFAPPAAPASPQYAPPAPQQYAPPVQPYGAPQAPQGYQPPPAPPVPAPAPVQQQAPPVAPPAPAPAAPAPAAAPAGMTPEQQAAIASLTPEQRAAMGYPAQ